MATKFLFEDDETAPISMLLKKSYKGNDIYFSGGCSKLLSTALAIQKPGDTIIIYCDVAPNNRSTTKAYNDLCITIKLNRYTNMIVVPIICIEYIVVQCLYKYNQLIIPSSNKDIEKYLIKDLDWNTYIATYNPNAYVRKSIEHFYKFFLTQIQQQRCKRNSHKYTNGVIDWNYGSGKYFYKDCPCGNHCNLNCMDSLHVKAERLYMELPLTTVKDAKHKKNIEQCGIDIHKLTLQDVEKERIAFYDKLCSNMNVNHIKIKLQ